jgi:membrane-associated protease RseP (regulator of RpoE activity)
MHKLATAVLGVLVLFLLAANARLRQDLERKVAGVPRPLPRAAEAPPAAELPVPAAPAPVPDPSPVAGAVAVPAPALNAVKELVRSSGSGAPLVGATFVLQNGGDDELGLSNDQKAVIDELRKTRDLQTQAIEERTEAAIRQVLRPDQLEKYDAPQKVDVVAQNTDAAPSGFLGVSGADADGGGVRLGQVFERSAAADMGLQVGDVILEVNGEKVAGYADLATKIQVNAPGAAVTLRINRGGTEWTQAVLLGKRQ